MQDETPTAGTDGSLFCEWCVEHWALYTATGGACRLLNISPIALRNGGLVEIAAEMPESLCNPFGSVHGGAISMLLDEVGGIATCCHAGLRYLRGTRNLNVEFIKRVVPGAIVATARVKAREGTVVTVKAELLQLGQIVARADAIYAVYPPGSVKMPARA